MASCILSLSSTPSTQDLPSFISSKSVCFLRSGLFSQQSSPVALDYLRAVCFFLESPRLVLCFFFFFPLLLPLLGFSTRPSLRLLLFLLSLSFYIFLFPSLLFSSFLSTTTDLHSFSTSFPLALSPPCTPKGRNNQQQQLPSAINKKNRKKNSFLTSSTDSCPIEETTTPPNHHNNSNNTNEDHQSNSNYKTVSDHFDDCVRKSPLQQRFKRTLSSELSFSFQNDLSFISPARSPARRRQKKVDPQFAEDMAGIFWRRLCQVIPPTTVGSTLQNAVGTASMKSLLDQQLIPRTYLIFFLATTTAQSTQLPPVPTTTTKRRKSVDLTLHPRLQSEIPYNRATQVTNSEASEKKKTTTNPTLSSAFTTSQKKPPWSKHRLVSYTPTPKRTPHHRR